MPNKIFEPTRRSLPKLRAKNILLFILAAGIVAALFVSPLPGREVSAAPPAQDFIHIMLHAVTKPPVILCVDDTAPITFTYMITSDYTEHGSTGNPDKVSITATSKVGTLSPASWTLNASMSTGTITTIYKGKKEGEEDLAFTVVLGSSGASQSTTLTFYVEKCDRTVIIMGDDYESGANGGFSSMIYGKGGVQTDENGVVMGGGPYQYFLGVQFTAPDKTFTCNKFVYNSTNSTFTAFGKAAGNGIELGLQFKPFDSADLVAHCRDNVGKTINYTVLKGMHIDPNPSLNLGTLSFSTGSGYISFNFGNGSGEVYLIKRKGGKQ